MTRSWSGILLCAALLIALVPRVAIAFSEADAMVGASSEDHLWLAINSANDVPINKDSKSRITLFHHAAAMNGPYFTPGPALTLMPEAMAAWGDRMWAVFPPQPGQSQPMRDVVTVQVLRNPALNGYYFSPYDRMSVVKSLTGSAQLADFVGTSNGPVALLLPPQFAESGVEAREGSTASKPVLDTPVLVTLTGEEWTQITLPLGFDPQQAATLAVVGSDGGTLCIVNGIASRRDSCNLFARAEDGLWTTSQLPIDARRVLSSTRSIGHAVLELKGRDSSSSISLAYLRSATVLSLTEMPVPPELWTILGMRDGLHLISRTTRGPGGVALTMAPIDPITGALGKAEPMLRQPLATGSIVHIPILVGLGLAALLMAFLFRPASGTKPLSLPPGYTFCPPIPRLVSLAMDLAPGAVLTMLILKCAASDLVRWAVWTTDIEQAAPSMLMISLTFLHATVCEIIWGRSLGKAVMGLTVVRSDGGRPGIVQIIIRNLFKMIMLLVPPLALFTLLNSNQQSLGDATTRTIVAHLPAEDEQSTDSNQPGSPPDGPERGGR